MVLASVSCIRDGLDIVKERGAAFIEAALDREVAEKVALECSKGTFERLAEQEGTARQGGEYFTLAGSMNGFPLVERLCQELTTTVHQQGSHIAGLESWHPNEAWIQRYRGAGAGITVHKDLKRYRLLIAVFTVQGTATFTVCRNRAGDAEAVWEAGPGSLVLLRGPELGGVDDGRPLHAVRGPSHGERISVSFRMNRLWVPITYATRRYS
jgi:hypothetical protein